MESPYAKVEDALFEKMMNMEKQDPLSSHFDPLYSA